jgi:hypothetical protein
LLLGGFPFVAGVGLFSAGVYALSGVLGRAARSGCASGARWSRYRGRAGPRHRDDPAAPVRGPPGVAGHRLSHQDRRRAPAAGSARDSRGAVGVRCVRGRVYYGAKNIVESLSFVGATAAVLILVAAVGGHRLRLARGYARRCGGSRHRSPSSSAGRCGRSLENLVPPIFESNFIGRHRAVLGFLGAVLAGLGVQVLMLPSWRFGRSDWVRPSRGRVAGRVS